MAKRPAASICQTKRKGVRRSAAGATVAGAMAGSLGGAAAGATVSGATADGAGSLGGAAAGAGGLASISGAAARGSVNAGGAGMRGGGGASATGVPADFGRYRRRLLDSRHIGDFGRCRRRCLGSRSRGSHATVIRRRLLLRSEQGHQHGGTVRAQLLDRDSAGTYEALRATRRPAFRRKGAGAKRTEACGAAEPWQHGRGSMKERAVAGERRRPAHRRPANRRRKRSAREKLGPAGSVATTRTAGVRSANAIREQAQSSMRHGPAPKPRRRSRRGSAGMRQACRQPDDLGGGRVATVEPARRQCRRTFRIEDRCRGRIGP